MDGKLKMLTAVDLFCGCGGLSAGFAKSGINVLAAFDNWDVAVDTYNRNLSDHAREMDLSDTETAIRGDFPY